MKDVVWIKVNALKSENPYDVSTPEGEQFIMFGPGGITRFSPHKDGSVLVGQRDSVYIKESPQYLMNVLQKIRNTEGVMDGNEEQDEADEGETPASAQQAESTL